MDYFDKVKHVELLSLSCLVNDIDYLMENRITEPRHRQSALLLRKYVENVIDDVSNLETVSIKNWEYLENFIINYDSYEKILSHFSYRFGTMSSKSRAAYNALDALCDEIVDRARLHNASAFHHTIICGGDPYTTNIGINLTCLRTTDIHRFWNWGLLGHELGHYITSVYYPSAITTSTPTGGLVVPIYLQRR